MLLPIGGGLGGLPNQEVPSEIKERYWCPWWFLVVLLFTTTICTFVALNVFGGLVFLIITIWAYYMTKNNCAEMSQYCMFSFGLMCCMQAVFELITLCMSVPGRRTQTTTGSGGNGDGMHGGGMHGGGMHGSTQTSSYTTTIVTKPFFDKESGWHYNFQSWMMIAGFVMMLISALLAHFTYKVYPTSLFDEPSGQEESQNFGGGGVYRQGGGQYGGGGGGQYGGGGGGHYGGNRPGGGGAPASQTQQRPVFGGSGHTLGRS